MHTTTPAYILRTLRAIPELGVPPGALVIVRPEASDRQAVVTFEPTDPVAALHALLADEGTVELLEVEGLAASLGLASVADGTGTMRAAGDSLSLDQTSPGLLSALLHVLRRQYGVRPAPPRVLSLVKTRAG